MASARSKNTYLGAKYSRLAKRRGKLRARNAVGHSILGACFHILAGGVPYLELGADHFQQRNSPEHRARKHLNDLRALGWDVTNTEHAVICLPPPTAA